MSFGERLEKWRSFRTLSLAALATKAGMHTSSVFRIAHDQQQAKQLEIERLADALGISQGMLLESDPPALATPDAPKPAA